MARMVRTHRRKPAASHRPRVSREVSREAWIVVGGLAIAFILVETQAFDLLALHASDYAALISFAVGTFFTSVVTTTPAIVAISELGHHLPAWQIALFGGAGAVCGDLLIFRFVRSPLAEYIIRISTSAHLRRMGAAFERGPFWWVVPAVGALIIASPLPDELGLIMMGLSEIRPLPFIVLSYVMNTAGIFMIASVAHTLG